MDSDSVKSKWFEDFKQLQQMIKSKADIDRIKKLLLSLHSQIHDSSVYDTSKTYYDEIVCNLCEENFRICPTKTNMTIAWDLWHITRIEDLTTSIFLCNDKQVFERYDAKDFGVKVTDTINAMTDEEVMDFSSKLSIKAMLDYRAEVGKKTKSFIEGLTQGELKRKFNDEQKQRVINEGGVIPETAWLADFWGRKNVGGVFLMPTTRHQMMHLNDCMRIVTWYYKRSK